MSIFTVSLEKENLLQARMRQLGVSEDDLRESFVRSSGPGGQKVNKTSSCVQLVHVPTGLSVKCQQERSQLLNRFLARRLLMDRLERLQRGLVEAEKMRQERIRRQKRKRSKRAKEKILQDKHHQAEKKVRRTRPPISDMT
jgi:peptide chain release factor